MNTTAEASGNKNLHTTSHQQRMLGKVAGISTEKSYDTVAKVGIAGALIYGGAVIGGAVGSSATAPLVGAEAGSSASAAAGTAVSGAVATSSAYASAGAGLITVSTSYAGTGAAIGAAAAAGTSGILIDRGEKIKHVHELKDYSPVQPVSSHPSPQSQPVQPDVAPVVSQPTIPTVTTPEPCPEQEWDADTCEHIVKPGTSYAYYMEKTVKINGKKPTGKYYKAYLDAQRLMYKVPHKNGKFENRFVEPGKKYVQYSDFSRFYDDEAIMKEFPNLALLKDAEITFDCDADLSGKIKKGKPQGKYNGHVGNPFGNTHFTQGCHDNLPVPHYEK